MRATDKSQPRGLSPSSHWTTAVPTTGQTPVGAVVLHREASQSHEPAPSEDEIRDGGIQMSVSASDRNHLYRQRSGSPVRSRCVATEGHIRLGDGCGAERSLPAIVCYLGSRPSRSPPFW